MNAKLTNDKFDTNKMNQQKLTPTIGILYSL